MGTPPLHSPGYNAASMVVSAAIAEDACEGDRPKGTRPATKVGANWGRDTGVGCFAPT